MFLLNAVDKSSEGVWNGFNPLFIRSVFLLFFCLPQSAKRRIRVSIPYSSGQCFFYTILFWERGNWHREFQSLIHQVSVSFKHGKNSCKLRSLQVSIPYSSGQCFFSGWRSDEAAAELGLFQSLIHQVSVSFLLAPLNGRKLLS